MIAHRLHMIKKADSILVLDKTGQIVDQTHHQLLLESQLYQKFLSNVQEEQVERCDSLFCLALLFLIM